MLDSRFKIQCQHCPNIETQAHIQHCPAYEHLRAGKNLDNDQDMVKYFQQVIAMREADVDDKEMD